MHFIFGFLAAAAGVYSLLIFIRIIISWFGGTAGGRPVELLVRVTDPYLDWWRRKLNLSFGFLDLSPIVGIAFLSIIQNILYSLSRFERFSVGNLLAIVILSCWSAVSFILGFCLLIIFLRFIAYITNRDIYSPFWRIIDNISQPLLYRLNRLFFGNRIASYVKGIVFSMLFLAVIWIGGGFLIPLLVKIISQLPF